MTGRAKIYLAAAMVFSLAACEGGIADKEDPLGSNVIDAAQINDLLLTAGDPNESVTYFEAALAQEPERADFRRGLAKSLTRAKRFPEAGRIYEEMIALGQDKPSDKLEFAMVSAHLQKWDEVERVVSTIPSGLNTSRRYVVEALLADHRQNWSASDAAYAQAESLTTNPASVLNNWGVSQMSRGDLSAATATFHRAVSYDSRLFSAKNNLAISRGLQGEYRLPLVPLTDEERAVLLNNLGIVAMRRGDEQIARGLFAAAVDAHPQFYASAADKLSALEATVQN